MHQQVIAGHRQRQVALRVGHAQARAELLHQGQAAHIVHAVAGQLRLRRHRLAQVVQQGGDTHRQREAQARADIDAHQGMHQGVDLGMVVGALRHAGLRGQLRHHPCQCAAIMQCLEVHARLVTGLIATITGKGALGFLPHPLRHQMIGFAALDHLPQQLHRFLGDAEAERREARGEAGHAQDAHRVFGEGGRDVAQDARLQVALAAVRIDQRAMFVPRHGVDGKVAADQVFLQRHLGAGVEGEAVIAAPGLALGARQGVLFLGLRMQEYREVLAHRTVAGGDHVFRVGAHHHPVLLLHRQAEQGVAHRAADQVGLHLDVTGDVAGAATGSDSTGAWVSAGGTVGTAI